MEEEQHHHYGGGGGGGSSANTTAMVDLRQFFSPIPTHHHHFPAPPSLFSPAAAYPHHYDTMMLVMGGGHDFRAESSAACASTAAMIPASSAAGASATGFDMDNAGGSGGGGFGLGVGGGDGGATARWPRQETLTLLEIRSRLDHKFKEANHKGPLWDEVSRIMSDEHGYQRSGKKCREKFENLYKYYKKTKEGKAGRQDGKHYRFFRQLEALYGEPSHHPHPNPIPDHTHLNMISNHTATPTATTTATAGGALQFHNTMNNHQEGFQSISLSNTSSDFDTSSSEGDDRVGSMGVDGDSSVDRVGRSRKRRGSGRGWKAKIKEFIDSQMRRIMEKQEAWLEKMMRSLENKEKERLVREEEWRKQEVMRMEREHKFWAKERAWIEARDKALMDALQRITGKKVGNLGEIDKLSQHEGEEEGNNEDVSEGDRWGELEIIKLMELRASIQSRFDECGGGPQEGDLWEEISTRMACLGHDRSPKMCKEKWDFISKELSNKSKEVSSRAGPTNKSHQYQHQEHHLQTTNLLYNYGHEMNGQGGMGLGPPQIGLGGGNPVNDSCLRILLGDGGETNPWESYGVKLNKGESTH